MPANIGLIGLGLMGSGLARRLIATGHGVLGYDIDAAKLYAAAEMGLTAATSAADVAAGAHIILVSVIDSAAVEDVALGRRGVMASGDLAGKILVDHSTTNLDLTRRIAAAVRERNGDFVDAPVSGGPEAAQNGTLAIMAGGPDAAIATIAPVMARLGKLTHMGPVGTGQATKLVNQTLVLTGYCILAEALRLAQAYGVAAEKIPDALAGGFAGSNLLQAIFPRMVAEDFAPRGYARQVLKDLEMLHAAARTHHLAMPMAAQALTLYRLLVAGGESELDAAAVVRLYPRPG